MISTQKTRKFQTTNTISIHPPLSKTTIDTTISQYNIPGQHLYQTSHAVGTSRRRNLSRRFLFLIREKGWNKLIIRLASLRPSSSQYGNSCSSFTLSLFTSQTTHLRSIPLECHIRVFYSQPFENIIPVSIRSFVFWFSTSFVVLFSRINFHAITTVSRRRPRRVNQSRYISLGF